MTARRGAMFRLACVLLLAVAGGVGCTQTEDPLEARTLDRGNGSEPDSLDPHRARMDSALTILRDTYEGLVALDRRAQPSPAVARSWRVSPDGLTYTFALDPAARWSNGDPVVAQDFVAAWRRLVDPATASQYALLIDTVRNARAIVTRRAIPSQLGIVAADARTLVVSLDRPTPYFLALLSHPATFPIHRPTLQRYPDTFAKPGVAVTNGPFVPSVWRVGTVVEVLRNLNYREAPNVALERVRYHHIVDARSETQRFRAGELDVTYTIPPSQVGLLRESLGSAVRLSPQLGVYYYGVATDQPPFRDAPGLARALSMVIDREVLVKSIIGSGESPAYGWVPPGVAGYAPQSPAWAGWPMDQRVAAALELYGAAGYSSLKPLKIELAYNKNDLHERIALAVAAMWKERLGVETTLRAEEFRVLKESIDARDVQVFRGSWIADYNDAYGFLQVLQGGFGINLPRYASADYDALLASARGGADRATKLAAAEQRLLEDSPVIPLYFYAAKHLVSPRVRGWYDNVMNVTYSQHLSLDPERDPELRAPPATGR